MQPFIANPNRDASDVIGGFVYQVDVTLLRWLTLQPGVILELERGEDIDIIQDWLKDGDLRTLEQVKRRSSPLTLRSPEAITAIANFCEHKANNPDQRLRFRYLTTSRTGKEKKWRLSGTAIEAWEALRQGSLTEKTRAEVVNEIRAFLLECPQPDTLSSGAWECLRSLLATEDVARLIELVETFEWSTGAHDDSATESDIKRALIESDYASDETAAEALFERLFLYVFRKLTQHGSKILTSAELVEQLAQPPLADDDRQLFLILGVVRSLSRKLDALEQRFSQEHGLVASLGVQLAQLQNSQGTPITIEYRDPIANLDSPNLVQPLIPRAEAVDQVANALARATWAHLIGEPGLGKTQLCVLVSQRLGSRTFWINLRDCTEDQACQILDVCIGAASGIGRHLLLREWYKQAASQLKGSNVIVDDLPKMSGGGRLAQRLEFLRDACTTQGVRLLTAGYYQLPRALIEPGSTTELNAPKLTNTEIGGLLVEHGAPASFANETVTEFLATLTQRLPVLVTAVAKFLASRGWNVEWSSLQSLLQGEFAKGIREDAEGVILDTVPDPDSRELLYRLRLIIGNFTGSEVEAISRVPKAIPLGLEKLKHLKGLWVQEYERDKYQVSALLDSSLSGYLESKTRRGVHATLALRLLSKNRLDQVDVFNAFYHFVAADLQQQAILLLIQALLSADQKGVIDHWGISQIWADRPLPSEIDINLRLFFRALQVGAFYKQGRDVTFLLQDFDLLLQTPDANQQWGSFMAASFLVIQFAFTKPTWANKYLLLALQNGGGDNILLPNGKKVKVPENARLDMAFWVTAHHCSSDQDVEDWLATIEQLTSERISRLKQSELAKDNVTILCDAIWLREYRKLESDRDWDKAEKLLIAVEKCAVKIGFPLLRAAAVRTQIVILAENRGRVNEAVDRAKAALAESQTDDERFLLLEVTGRQLAYGDQWDQAVEWLKNALALDVDGFPIWQRNDLLTLSEGIAQSDVHEATRYTEKAVEVSKTSILEPLRTAEALAEHAIALWFASDHGAAFNSLQQGIEILMGAKQAAFWNKTFLLFLHTVGYFGSVALSGSPPNPTFESPSRGMFLATDNISADLYKPVQESLLFIRLAMFAEGVGNWVAAGKWTKRALEQPPDEGGITTLLRWSSWLMLTPALLSEDWKTPIQIADLILGMPSVSSSAWDDLGISSEADKAKLSHATADQALKDRGFHNALVPLVLRLATLRFIRPITENVAVVERMLLEKSLTNGDLWQEMAELIRVVFATSPNWKELHERVSNYYGGGRVGFGMVAYVGCILHSPLLQSLAFQIGFAKDLERLFLKKSSIFAQIVEPFFLEYWRKATENNDMGFRTAPSYAGRRVVEISMHQAGKRLRPLLREMTFCVGLTAPAAHLEWLEAEE